MLFEFSLRMARDFDGGKLPHAGEEHFVVRARIFHQDCAAARIEKNRGGDFYAHGGAFDAGRGNFICQAKLVSAAPFRDRADFAAGILGRANRLAQFH